LTACSSQNNPLAGAVPETGTVADDTTGQTFTDANEFFAKRVEPKLEFCRT